MEQEGLRGKPISPASQRNEQSRWGVSRGDLFCLGGVGELQRRDLSRAWRGLEFGLGVKKPESLRSEDSRS